MKRATRDRQVGRGGFSLIEILVVIAVMAILMAAVVKVAETVFTNAKIRNTETTIRVLMEGLEEYRSYQEGRGRRGEEAYPTEPYAAAADPANSFTELDWDAMEYCIGGTGEPGAHGDFAGWDDGGDIENLDGDGDGVTEGDERRGAMASSEVLYWYLDSVPASRAVLSRLPDTAGANADGDWIEVGQQKGLIEVNDAWGHPIRYETREGGNVPELTSAGPDGVFDNSDDVVSSAL